ncbi:MAG TPA: GtrA family protein [Solirubrobacteraceae bacterium]|nr:GtrA family protein [Solirubrobacteraceae bacterium]
MSTDAYEQTWQGGAAATEKDAAGGRRLGKLLRVLRAPDPGIARQGLRFALAGGTVAFVYLAITTALSELTGLPFQAALAIGWCCSIAVHFTLQRQFVWRHHDDFALPLSNQTGRYLAVAGAQYGVTVAATSLLPAALGVSAEAVYLTTVTVLVVANFLIFRNLVFHARAVTGAVVEEDRRRTPGRRARPGISASRGSRLKTPGPRVIDATIGTLVVLLIASPLLLTGEGFGADFTNAIWLSNYQQHAISTNLHPTLFLQTSQLGVFEPFFAFYGGTLFALTGALGVALNGSTMLAFEVMTIVGIAAAYGGPFWLSRQLGVRGIMAHAPAIVYVTSAYYITNLYGRGDWTEFMGASTLPLVIAATLRVVRGPWRIMPAICLVAVATIFTGSHNITLMLGTTLTVLVLAALWLGNGMPRALPWRRMLTAAGLLALGAALNAWFLLPDVSYAKDTLVGTEESPWVATGFFNTVSVMFDPLRTVPPGSTTPALYVQIPVLALVWGLLMVPLAWRYKRLRAGAITALVALGALLLVIMSRSAYEGLPKIIRAIEFPYRLQTYVTLACSGLVLVGALALTRRARRGRAKSIDVLMKLGLAIAVAFGIGVSVWQLWVPDTQIVPLSYPYRDEVTLSFGETLPKSWYAPDNYADASLPIVGTQHSIAFNPERVSNDRIAGTGKVPAGGQPFATNIYGGPYLVHVGGGVHVAGRTSTGALVLKRNQGGSQPVRIEIQPALSTPVVLGKMLTIAAAILLIGLGVLVGVRRVRRRLGREAAPATDRR